MKLSSCFFIFALVATLASCGSDSNNASSSGERPPEKIENSEIQKFAGEWTGKGVFLDTFWGEKYHDAEATITITLDAKTVTFKDCWAFTTEDDGSVTSCAESKLNIVGSELFYEDTLYGTVSGNEINVKLLMDNYNLYAKIKLSADGVLDYTYSANGKDNDGKDFSSYQAANGLKK